MAKKNQSDDSFSMDDLFTEIDEIDGTISSFEGGLPSGLEKPVKPVVEDDDDDNNDDEDIVEDDVEEDEEDEEPSDEDDVDDVEDDDDDFTLPFMEDLHSHLGFEEEFDAEAFVEEFGTGMEGIKNFITEVIKDNSKPQFSNETAQKYFEFIESGGDPKDLKAIIDSSSAFVDIDSKKLEDDESLQKRVYSEYLKITNPKRDASWISSKVSKLYDSGMLEEESMDALTTVQDYYNDREAKLLQAKQASDAQAAKELEAYWNNEEKVINSTNEIAGVTLTPKLKAAFTKYYKNGGFSEAVKSNDAVRELAFIKFVGVESITKAVKTKVSSKVEETLRRYKDSKVDATGRTRQREKGPSDIKDLEI